MTTCTAIAVLAAIGTGAVLGALSAAAASKFGVGRLRAVTGGALVAVLTTLSAADLMVSGLGPWWADRPIAAAALTGLMFLGIAVLLIEEIVERLEASRWRAARDFAGIQLVNQAKAGWSDVADAYDEVVAAGRPEHWTKAHDVARAVKAVTHLMSEAQKAKLELDGELTRLALLLTAGGDLQAFERAMTIIERLEQLRLKAGSAMIWFGLLRTQHTVTERLGTSPISRRLKWSVERWAQLAHDAVRGQVRSRSSYGGNGDERAGVDVASLVQRLRGELEQLRWQLEQDYTQLMYATGYMRDPSREA